MELTVRLLCRPQLAPGFALAGLKVRTAEPAEAAAALRALASERGVGLVLVDELLHRAVPAEVLQKLERGGLPLVASFPGPRWGEERLAEEYVLEILRQAIGYRVRPR